jgi:hypothetical protein
MEGCHTNGMIYLRSFPIPLVVNHILDSFRIHLSHSLVCVEIDILPKGERTYNKTKHLLRLGSDVRRLVSLCSDNYSVPTGLLFLS